MDFETNQVENHRKHGVHQLVTCTVQIGNLEDVDELNENVVDIESVAGQMEGAIVRACAGQVVSDGDSSIGANELTDVAVEDLVDDTSDQTVKLMGLAGLEGLNFDHLVIVALVHQIALTSVLTQYQLQCAQKTVDEVDLGLGGEIELVAGQNSDLDQRDDELVSDNLQKFLSIFQLFAKNLPKLLIQIPAGHVDELKANLVQNESKRARQI